VEVVAHGELDPSRWPSVEWNGERWEMAAGTDPRVN
jgi:hypothetical protein